MGKRGPSATSTNSEGSWTPWSRPTRSSPD